MTAATQQLLYLLDLLDDETPLVRQAVVRELASFGPALFDELKTLPVEVTPKDRWLLNAVLESPRRSFIKREWPTWLGLSDEYARLEKALTILAEYQSGLEFTGQLKGMLDHLAEEYQRQHPNADPYVLAEFLFKTLGFVGESEDYYNPNNSNLIYVIQQRRGIPISLSCVYMLVGARLGLMIRGCNSPRHFLTIVQKGAMRQLVDCFHAGRVITEKEIATLSRESTLSLDEALKMEADTLGIIRRVLGNLIFAYQQVDRERDSYLMVHLLKAIQLFEDQKDKDLSKAETLLGASCYALGQKVVHADEGYRGIVVDYDLYCVTEKEFLQDEDRPDANQPWYRLLIDRSDQVLYVPHAQLICDLSDDEIYNPLVSHFFEKLHNGNYLRNQIPWIE